MSIECAKCGADLSSGQVICAGRLCTACYEGARAA